MVAQMQLHRLFVLALLAATLLGCAGAGSLADESMIDLPRLSIDPARISISGLSSGADFSAQFCMAFSSILTGCGVYAGQPPSCAITRFTLDPLVNGSDPSVPHCLGCPPNTTLTYDHCKVYPDIVEVDKLVEYARTLAAAGKIDALEHLRDLRLYLYRGTNDATYFKGSVANVGAVFAPFMRNPMEQILLNNTVPSAHSWPTVHYGTPCGQGVIERCNYDGPGDCLQHIYRQTLTAPSNWEGYSNASLFDFDQAPFVTGNATLCSLAPAGRVYIPAACAARAAGQSNPCALHLALHGCNVDGYYDAASHWLFNAWAEANRIVVVYPRIRPYERTKQTEMGCYDAYAQTGLDYSTRSGLQMQALAKMIERVSGVPVPGGKLL